MACADFDGQVVRQDQEIAALARQFICVRIQSMNGINLDLFQFEYDLTWMAFFMDDRDRFYARYGGRVDEDAESHLTQQSLARLMRQVVDLHRTRAVQTSRYEPRGRNLRTPEQIPTMAAMLRERKNKCIHCHDVKVAQLRHLQNLGQFAREQVFTYPTPANVGLTTDPQRQNVVTAVTANSPAARSGIRAGDRLTAADGQRILTFGDFSRVLEKTPRRSRLDVVFQRGGKSLTGSLQLAGNWRQTSDPSWRESLHVAGPNCGLWGKQLSAADKNKRGIAAGALGLKVTFIWGAHTRRAGLQTGDIIVALDGVRREMTIQQLHSYPMLKKDYGDSMPIIVLRGKRQVPLTMRFPKQPVD
ncbi:MAG: hypothetical protein CMJ59_24420 [Planctomycetaceae bacterium]|nr:hypothetical protein [Planctomycetaceae bacterium]